MRVDTPKASKPVLGHARAPEIGHLELFSRTDHHILNLSLAVEQHAHLAASLVRYLRHLPRKLRRHDLI
jgi:hypothetical protein